MGNAYREAEGRSKKLEREIASTETLKASLTSEVDNLSGRARDLRKDYDKMADRHAIRERALDASIAVKEKQAKEHAADIVKDANRRSDSIIADAGTRSLSIVEGAQHRAEQIVDEALNAVSGLRMEETA